MNKHVRFAALATLLGCTSAYAGGQQPASPPNQTATATQMPEFSTLDANGDGAISQEEAKNQVSLSAIFGDVDANKDGKLDSREYAEARNRIER